MKRKLKGLGAGDARGVRDGEQWRLRRLGGPTQAWPTAEAYPATFTGTPLQTSIFALTGLGLMSRMWKSQNLRDYC